MTEMPDSASWLERETDAGTKPLIPLPQEPDPDEAYDRLREKEDE